MEITSYNQHRSAPFSEPWSLNSYQVYSVEGADNVIQSGLIVYMEHLAANAPADRDTQNAFRREVDHAQRLVFTVLPPSGFFALAAAINDSCDWDRLPALVEDFLSGLESSRIEVTADIALQFLPSSAFGGAFNPGDMLLGNASEALQAISDGQRGLLREYLTIKTANLRTNEELRQRFSHAFRR